MWKIGSSRSDQRAAAAQRALQLAESDARANELERLQDDQEAHVAAIAIVEIFTPSMVEDLKKAVRKIPFKSRETNRKVEEYVLLGRRNTLHRTAGGIGVGHPPGFDGLMPDETEFTDSSIPEGVDAVRTIRYGLVPSLTVLVTTFSISSPSDDLTEIMREDYKTRHDYYKSKLADRVNSIMYRVKGSKGTLVTGAHNVIWPNNVRREACEMAITQLEEACAKWMSNRFPGSFSRLQASQRPLSRVITVKNAQPFAGSRDERERLHALHLDSRRRVWRSAPDQHRNGWSLCTHFLDNRPSTAIAAGRVDEILRDSPTEGSGSYEAAQIFEMTYGDALARMAVDGLLSQYSHNLTAIRDKAIEEDPVASAQRLAGYLLKDGLDVSTMTAEIIHEDMPNYMGVEDRLVKDDGVFNPAGQRKRKIKIPETWPWAHELETAFQTALALTAPT